MRISKIVVMNILIGANLLLYIVYVSRGGPNQVSNTYNENLRVHIEER